MHARLNELNGKQYSTLRPAANLLQNTDPIAATLLYRKMIETILDQTKYKYYSYAAKNLITCGTVSSTIMNWKTLQNHEEYLKVIETKHKKKVSFWSTYKSALQEQASKKQK